jgi:hypothetical protein
MREEVNEECNEGRKRGDHMVPPLNCVVGHIFPLVHCLDAIFDSTDSS